MISHIVIFVWLPSTTEADVAEIHQGLAALPAQIPELLDYRFGPDLNLNEGTADYGIVATVADAPSLVAYRDHPEHVKVVNRIRELAATRLATQIHVD